MKHLDTQALKRFAAAVLACLFIFSTGWVADYLREGFDEHCVFKVNGLLISSVILLLSGWGLFHLRKSFLPIATFREGSVPRPHKAVILTVSAKRGAGVTEVGVSMTMSEAETRTIPLTGDLDADIKALDGLRWPWQQLMRAIHPHRETIEQLYLVGSWDMGNSQGSHGQLEECARLLKRYLKKEAAVHYCEGVDFHKLSAVQEVFENTIKQLLEKKYRQKDIIVDVTGGFKTTSIGAALATLRFDHVEFQYVPEQVDGGPHQPIGFNVVTVSPINLE